MDTEERSQESGARRQRTEDREQMVAGKQLGMNARQQVAD